MPQQGLVDYVTAVARRHRPARDRLSPRHRPLHRGAAPTAVAAIPTVIGFKDGVGDRRPDEPDHPADPRGGPALRCAVPLLQRACPPPRRRSGLPCDRGAAVLLGGLRLRARPGAGVLRCARTRRRRGHGRAARPASSTRWSGCATRRPGYAVSLSRPACALEGVDAGGVRPPLIDADADDEVEQLRAIIAAVERCSPAALAEACDDPSRFGSPARGSPRSHSPTRRCSTRSGCMSRTRCGRSSSSTRTPGWSGSARRMPTPAHLVRLAGGRRAVIGLDVFATQRDSAPWPPSLHGDRRLACRRNRRDDHHGRRPSTRCSRRSRSLPRRAGQAAGRPVCDLLGGAVRDAVPFSAYLFYKWAAHHPGRDHDAFGAALDPDGIVRAGQRMVAEYGFTALKLKGGVFPPDEEIAAVRALRAAFPDRPLRLDPNAVWTVADLGHGRAGSWTGVSSTWRTRRPAWTAWPRSPGRRRAAGDQHVRRRVRRARARGREAFGRRHPVRPSLLGRPAALPAARRHLRDLRPWACRCTPTPTSASAWRRWCTWPRPRRT